MAIKNVLTPFIDGLSERCIKFTKSYSVGPYTQASFPGILASSYFLEYDGTPKLSPKSTLISEVLKEAGIYTAAFHSNPYLSGYFGWNRGWDVFYDSMEDEVDDINPYIKGNIINEKVDNWLSAHVADDGYKPFFLWAHFMDVHEPYVPDRKYIQKIDSKINLQPEEYMELFKNVIIPRDVSNKDTVTLLKKLYDANVVETDEYVNNLFSIFERHNVLNDSIVIITSDHGDEFNDHGSLSHDGKMYSELVQTPFMILDPSLSNGETCSNLISGIDIPPTVLDLFGLEPSNNFKGKSVLPTEGFQSEGCYGECLGKLQHKMLPTDKPTYFFIQDDFKIIYREDSQQWELYNLREDPGELNNIVDSSEARNEMENKLNEFINRQK